MKNSTPNIPPSNPLASLMRRPKLSINLPSKGNFWENDSIELSENNEYSVYSLTARDEMALKNPASVASGDAIVNVIHSCVPNIKNAWLTPSIDLDALMIGVMIASEGNIIKVKKEINKQEFICNINLYDVLNDLLDRPEWESKFQLDDEITIFLKPPVYKTLTLMGKEAVETQKIMDIVNDETADNDKKIEVFRKSFTKLTNITMSFVQDCIYQIDIQDQTVDNKNFIVEFVENCDSEIFNKIKSRIDNLLESYNIRPVKLQATKEMIDAGSDEEIELEINPSISKFFAGDSE